MQVFKLRSLAMTQPPRSPCPISRTLDLIGDRWTLLIIRDMMFFNKQRFEEFLESPEGISTNILANRLKLLEELGLAQKQPYGSHSRRMNYQLTDKGKSLRPVLKVMAVWGLKQIEETQIPPGMTTATSGTQASTNI
jgi:DNA-binding HxlR family transcriptional regulator